MRELFEDFSFCLPSNEQMLGYPVAGPDNDLRQGHRRYNFVWYRPASEAEELPRLLTDETGRTHALSIPPPLIARDVVAKMREEAARRPRAAIQRDGVAVRAAVPAADLRSRGAAHGVRPRRGARRCGLRRAPACRRRRREGGRGRAGARRCARAQRRSGQRTEAVRIRTSAGRRQGSSSARAISAPTCRRT